jgi:hypothetical protein
MYGGGTPIGCYPMLSSAERVSLIKAWINGGRTGPQAASSQSSLWTSHRGPGCWRGGGILSPGHRG